MKPEEAEERTRLQACLEAIDLNLQAIGSRLHAYAQEVKESKTHIWEARRDMDHIEKIAIRETIDQKLRSAEVIRAQRQKLRKLRRSPYFGRVDFTRQGKADAEPVYVGVHDFQDDETKKTLVYDWRAPISSLFYDYETGPARYETPGGEVSGRIERKRQFRIRDGQLEFMLESGLNIVDEVLQQELSRSSDDGMKNIVATIQRDQNAIVRDAEAHTLIIQGVAGSGKTSIALHRIAFLLYRFKDSLGSSDVLIVSPNRVFADYIGNVLPELGEEMVGEIGMEDLAGELLGHKYRFQTFFEQTAQLLEKDDEALKARIAAKASPDFLKRIDAYVEHLEAGSFAAVEWRTGKRIVPEWFFEESWRKYRGMGLTERIGHVVGAAEHQIGIYYNHDLRTEERRSLREAVRGMVRRPALREAYKNLFVWMERPDLYKTAGGRLEYADVFPLIHLKMKLEGIENPYKDVKHLLIDEMQDYTPLQYAVLGRLFNCRKTILGDASQAVNPYSASTAGQIRDVLRAAAPVKLTRSYRSTWEIMRFALAISPNDELIPMERHGEPPQLVVCRKQGDVVTRLIREIGEFESSDHKTLAIIARTQKEAKKVHAALAAAGREVRLLDGASAGFSAGAMICTAHLAKGLEFDRVIVPGASAANYSTEMDRNLLYVACTRAMHRLTLIANGAPAPFLPKQP
ncbi:3'-5' exonuclease [Parvibaculum sp.]|uniref:HelD family protein n=1 Tax=Parvibaculum sp. TaxID=2024848 RepID=UPI00349FD9AA